MKTTKTKAELLSEYVSKHMKDSVWLDDDIIKYKKPKSESVKEESSVKSENMSQNLISSKNKRTINSSSKIANNIQIAKGQKGSVYSLFPSQKEEVEAKEELKNSQIEVNSVHEKRSTCSVPVKIWENDSSNSQNVNIIKKVSESQNYYQGNLNIKMEKERNVSKVKSEYPYFMRPHMSMHSQMMSQSYPNGYQIGIPYHHLPSQPMSNYGVIGAETPGNMVPGMMSFDNLNSNNAQLQRSLLHNIPSNGYPYGGFPPMPMRMNPWGPGRADFNSGMPPDQQYYQQMKCYPPHQRHSIGSRGIKSSQNSYQARERENYKYKNYHKESKSYTPGDLLNSGDDDDPDQQESNSDWESYQILENPERLGSDLNLNKHIFPYLNRVGIDTKEIMVKSSWVNNYNNYWIKPESRRGSGVYYPDDKPVLQNIVSTWNLCWRLDLSKIAMQAKNTEFNPKRFAAAIMKIKHPKTTALIFSSGKMVWTGAKSEEDSKYAAKKFAKTVQIMGYPVRFTEFKIQNIVGSCDLRFSIRLESLHIDHHAFASYDPEIFPGLIYRVMNPKVVILVFVSGKIVLTGAKTREEITRAYEYIYPVLKRHRKRDESYEISKQMSKCGSDDED